MLIAIVSRGPRFLFNLLPTFVISSACCADKSSWTCLPQSRAALHCREGPSCCWECVRSFCPARDLQLYLFISFHPELYPKSALLILCSAAACPNANGTIRNQAIDGEFAEFAEGNHFGHLYSVLP